MKHIFLGLIAIMALYSCSNESKVEDENLPENIYEGDLVLNTQIEVEDFGNNKYTRVNGG